MLIEFRDKKLEELYVNAAYAPKGYHPELVKKYRKLITFMANANNIKEIYERPSLNYERLSGAFAEYYSVRINKQWRLLFTLQTNEIVYVMRIEEISKHYE